MHPPETTPTLFFAANSMYHWIELPAEANLTSSSDDAEDRDLDGNTIGLESFLVGIFVIVSLCLWCAYKKRGEPVLQQAVASEDDLIRRRRLDSAARRTQQIKSQLIVQEWLGGKRTDDQEIEDDTTAASSTSESYKHQMNFVENQSPKEKDSHCLPPVEPFHGEEKAVNQDEEKCSSSSTAQNNIPGYYSEPRHDNDTTNQDKGTWSSSLVHQKIADSHLGDEDGCSICLAPFQVHDRVCESNNLSCKHMFHEECMVAWLEKHDVCPVCRQAYIILDEEQGG